MKIAMTSIPVNDPIKAFDFYTKKLGFKEHLYQPEHQLAIVESPEQPGGTTLMLEPNSSPISKSYQQGLYNANIPAIVLGTSDIQKEFERLTSEGVVFRREPTKQSWGIDTLFEDTCGNLILLVQQ